jgi:hypothetical protein
MKHAGPDTLTAIEPLLRQLRAYSSLVERTPGSFYRNHHDPAAIGADEVLLVSRSYLHFFRQM